MEQIALFTGESRPILALVVSLIVTGVAHVTLFSFLCRISVFLRSWRHALGFLRWPSFWLALGIVASIAIRSLAFEEEIKATWRLVAGFLLPGLFGWLAIGVVRALRSMIELKSDISVADNLRARRRRTRIAILSRILMFAILFVTVSIMLLSIPSIRSVGYTLMASAGLAAIVVGAAAQPAMKNIIGGIQMAFTEPIRIDDVLIVDGEWGRVEQINLTYVVVALWDERRLVVPVSRFLDQPFENWTRRTSQLLGTVFLYLDPRADIERIRNKLGEILPDCADWDQRVGLVQVTEMTADAVEVRLLLSSTDASKAFDLRCEVREKMIAFIQTEMPEALPHRREMWSEVSAQGDGTHERGVIPLDGSEPAP